MFNVKHRHYRYSSEEITCREGFIPPTENIQNCKYVTRVNYPLVFNKQSTTSVSYNLLLKSILAIKLGINAFDHKP